MPHGSAALAYTSQRTASTSVTPWQPQWHS